MSSLTRQQLEAWLKTLDVKCESVLDVGGAQKSIRGRTKSWEVENYQVLDLPEPHEKHESVTQTMDLNEPYLDDDASALLEEIGKKIEGYDVVFCLEVMEYIWNPVEACKNLALLTKEGGVLYMSVPFVYPVHNPKHNDYLRYTDMGISKLLENAGFKVDELIPRKAEYFNLLDAFYSGEGMKKSREYGSHESTGWLIKATKNEI